MDGLRRALIEDADDLAKANTGDFQLAPARALHIDGDNHIVVANGYPVPCVVQEADSIGPCALQAVGEVVNCNQKLIAGGVPHGRHQLETDLGQRSPDDSNIVVGVLEPPNFGDIALVADHQGNTVGSAGR